MPNDFITIETLATFGGMVLALGIIVQATKGILKDFMPDVWVRPYAFLWALILVGTVYWYQGKFDALGASLALIIIVALINALIVTLAAMGGYDALTDPLATKEKPE